MCLNCKEMKNFKFPYVSLGEFTYEFTTNIKANKHYFKCCVDNCEALAYTSIKKTEQGVFHEDPRNNIHTCMENHLIILCGYFKEELYRRCLVEEDIEALHGDVLKKFIENINGEKEKEDFKTIIDSAFSLENVRTNLLKRKQWADDFMDNILSASSKEDGSEHKYIYKVMSKKFIENMENKDEQKELKKNIEIMLPFENVKEKMKEHRLATKNFASTHAKQFLNEFYKDCWESNDHKEIYESILSKFKSEIKDETIEKEFQKIVSDSFSYESLSEKMKNRRDVLVKFQEEVYSRSTINMTAETQEALPTIHAKVLQEFLAGFDRKEEQEEFREIVNSKCSYDSMKETMEKCEDANIIEFQNTIFEKWSMESEDNYEAIYSVFRDTYINSISNFASRVETKNIINLSSSLEVLKTRMSERKKMMENVSKDKVQLFLKELYTECTKTEDHQTLYNQILSRYLQEISDENVRESFLESVKGSFTYEKVKVTMQNRRTVIVEFEKEVGKLWTPQEDLKKIFSNVKENFLANLRTENEKNDFLNILTVSHSFDRIRTCLKDKNHPIYEEFRREIYQLAASRSSKEHQFLYNKTKDRFITTITDYSMKKDFAANIESYKNLKAKMAEVRAEKVRTWQKYLQEFLTELDKRSAKEDISKHNDVYSEVVVRFAANMEMDERKEFERMIYQEFPFKKLQGKMASSRGNLLRNVNILIVKFMQTLRKLCVEKKCVKTKELHMALFEKYVGAIENETERAVFSSLVGDYESFYSLKPQIQISAEEEDWTKYISQTTHYTLRISQQYGNDEKVNNLVHAVRDRNDKRKRTTKVGEVVVKRHIQNGNMDIDMDNTSEPVIKDLFSRLEFLLNDEDESEKNRIRSEFIKSALLLTPQIKA